ncbi:Helix-loop-helix DNA-binding protein [Metarhizium guizhouense ARSEF 977]|uniref:Helix-loop-helix DNA-binding protein n=1 Tax=Metarhizium guizhouense (strain ARSEF 977) TaxID=1276136 RepID=A0A0B4GPU5_METGA|nr:Helix-loop-helix DNA-binding protein [Metarhizium guizhouense ARSEF 977]
MSSPNNTSTSSRENAAAGADEKPRLTEEEKKQNHIASEQKRRQAIREGFDRLTELVPGLEGQGRSEGLVLKRTVEYMRQQMQERRALIERIEQSGGHVDDELKKLVCSSLKPHFSHSTSTGRALHWPSPPLAERTLSSRNAPVVFFPTAVYHLTNC